MSALRRVPGWVWDWTFVALMLALVVPEVAETPEFADQRALAIVCAVGFVVPLGFRRRRPLLVIVAAWSSCALGSIAIASFFHLDTPFPVVLFCAYTAGTIPSLRGSVAGLAVTLAGLTVVNLTFAEAVTGDYIFPGGFVVGMWAVSRTLLGRALLAAELHEAAAAAADRREEAAARAVTEERRRIAREMHDLVGHSISVMVVQAGGARRILELDADRAVEAAVRIEATGREALAEMRRLLGLLGSDEGTLDPQPTLEALDRLVERAREAGLPVTVEVTGERRGLPAGAEVAAYRIVQESLTNAIKHAGAAPTSVALHWGPDALEITVADRGTGAAPAADGGGHGIVGMRERVRVYGGELSAEPRTGGGFVVRAQLPYAQGALVAA